jgi:hypothetical protein
MQKWLIFLICCVAFCCNTQAQQNHMSVSANVAWLEGRGRGTELAMHHQFSTRRWVASRISTHFEKDNGSGFPISYDQIQGGSATQITGLNKRLKIFVEGGLSMIFDRKSSIFWSRTDQFLIDFYPNPKIKQFYYGLYARSDFRLPLFDQINLVGGIGYSVYPSIRNDVGWVRAFDARLGIGYRMYEPKKVTKK